MRVNSRALKRASILMLTSLVLTILIGCSSDYQSPVKYTATYEIITSSSDRQAIFTDNYTITDDFVILHGYSNKNADISSKGDLLISKGNIAAIQANPYLGKEGVK